MIAVLLWPSVAAAVQSHGGTEGLVAHQLGHALFIFGLISLFYKISPARFKEPGWGEFKAFLCLLVFWNLLTVAGHWMREFVDPGKFATFDGQVVGFTLDGPWDAFFYLTRLDHLLLVPAFFLLLLALRQWRQQS